MKIHLLTLFPEMFRGPFEHSIIKRAGERGLVTITSHNLRQWAIDKRGTVDGRVYGGGAGMVLRVEPIYNALQDLKKTVASDAYIVLLTPQGKKFTQSKARKLSKLENLILICGHYEGFDERVRSLVNEEISIGNFVLTGGELPAMVIVDSIVRLLPGVLAKAEATTNESFSKGKILEEPQYTRPESFLGMSVPKILLSGDHGEIAKWRNEHQQTRVCS